MKNKGFTLIELLAVIVILAIIALIATPIVLGIINNAKEESNQRSVELYVNAIKNAVARYHMKNDKSISGSFISSEDGRILTSQLDNNLKLSIDYDGSVFCETIEIFSNGRVVLDKCKIDGKEIGTTTGTDNDKLEDAGSLCEKVSVAKENEYNLGDKYLCKVNSEDKYNFYILSIEGDKINLILEANVNKDGIPITSNSLSNNSNIQSWYSSSEHENGPVTAFEYISTSLSGWTKIPNIEIDYVDEGSNNKSYYGGIKTVIIDDDYVTTITKKDGTITGTFKNVKARLPKLSEVKAVGCKNPRENSNASGTCPLWLSNMVGSNGYWMLASALEIGDGYTNKLAWYISFDGTVAYGLSPNAGSWAIGIRPVITLTISDLG